MEEKSISQVLQSFHACQQGIDYAVPFGTDWQRLWTGGSVTR